MFYVQDNYFQKEAFQSIQKYCENEFEIVEVGGKKFSLLQTPEQLLQFLQKTGYEITLTFIRSAHKDFDTDLRIHADNIINGKKTALASVFYINSEDEVDRHGTRFHKHHKYGSRLPDNVSNKEFDRLLKEDSNDPEKWTTTDIIIGEPNRMLTYEANYFHSKFPSKIERGTRKVLVCFYAKL